MTFAIVAGGLVVLVVLTFASVLAVAELTVADALRLRPISRFRFAAAVVMFVLAVIWPLAMVAAFSGGVLYFSHIALGWPSC